jgi:hypothetical protein
VLNLLVCLLGAPAFLAGGGRRPPVAGETRPGDHPVG